MKFKTVTIQNFMSIREIKLKLNERGLVLVQGKNNDDSAFESNGSGKSSIFEAITYVLFDRTIRGLKADDVVNNITGKNCVVFLDLEDENGIEYRISRYRKHSEHKNSVYVFQDGVNISLKSNKDTNLLIEQLIKMDYDTFTNSILFGQGLVKMFSLSSDAEKKTILEKMLSMSVFKCAQEVAKERLSSSQSELGRIETLLTVKQGLIKELEANILSLKEKEKEHRLNTNKEIKRLTEEFERAEGELNNHNKNSLNESLKNLKQYKKDKDVINERINEFFDYVKIKQNLLIQLQTAINEKDRFTDELKDIQVEIENVKKGKETICPTCGQEISPKTDRDSAILHFTKKAKKLLKLIQDSQKQLDKKNQELSDVNEKLTGKELLEKERDVILEKIFEVNALIKTEDNTKKLLESRVTELKNSIDHLREELEKTYKPLIDATNNKLEESVKMVEELIPLKADCVKMVEQLTFWVNAFGNSGIKSYLLDTVTPYLNTKANYYLGKLSGSTTEIEFSTQTRLKSGEVREKFEVRINNLVGGTSYDSNSTGERKRIDLAISLALQDLVMSRSNGKLNILLYDECFDGLDSVGCENVIQLLQEVSNNTESIFVITHNDHLKPFFDNTLDVVKEKGITSIGCE